MNPLYTLDYESLFDTVPAPCMVLDRALCFVAANRAYLASVGRTMEEIRGTFVFDSFPEEPERRARFDQAFRTALDGQDNSLIEEPFAIADAESPGGMREIWWNCHHHAVRDATGAVTHVVQNANDVTDRVRAERMKDAIAGELQHRVKNLFNLVSVIARRSAEKAEDLDTFIEDFSARLQNMAETHSLLTGSNWDGIDMDGLLRRQLSQHLSDDAPQVTIEGPYWQLDAREAQAVSMAIHELTTNAMKYGALSSSDGKVRVIWRESASGSRGLVWQETGKGIGEPGSDGFGSTMLMRLLPAQLNATAEREFTPEGLKYDLRFG